MGGIKIKRKVIQIANSTMLVSLPRKWVQENNVKKGDEIDILYDSNNNIIISVDAKPSVESVEINISGKLGLIEKLLGAVYKKGYDVINITFSSPEELEKIHQTVGNGLIGVEIVDEKSNKVSIKTVSALDPSQFDSMLRRCFLFLLSMSDDIIDYAKNNDKTGLKNLALRDKNINKITDFCRRSLNKFGHEKFNKPAAIYSVVEGLEKVGDYYKELALLMSEVDHKYDKNQLEIFQKVAVYLRLFYNQFYDFKVNEVFSLIENRKKILTSISAIIEKDKLPVRVFYYLEIITVGVYNLNGPLMVSYL